MKKHIVYIKRWVGWKLIQLGKWIEGLDRDA